MEVVSIGEVLLEVPDPGSDFLITFVEVDARGEPQAIEHDELRWVKPRELVNLEMAPADQHFAKIASAADH